VDLCGIDAREEDVVGVKVFLRIERGGAVGAWFLLDYIPQYVERMPAMIACMKS